MKKQLLWMLVLIVSLFVAAEKARGEEGCIVPVKLKIMQFAQIIPDTDIVLEQKDGDNFEGLTALTVFNNYPIQITAKIESAGTKIADNYMCNLDDTGWSQEVSITTGPHLYKDYPGTIILSIKLENVHMGKVLYQDALLNVAQVVITIAPAI